MKSAPCPFLFSKIKIVSSAYKHNCTWYLVLEIFKYFDNFVYCSTPQVLPRKIILKYNFQVLYLGLKYVLVLEILSTTQVCLLETKFSRYGSKAEFFYLTKAELSELGISKKLSFFGKNCT